jgi:excisionase family DNA binding protein
MEDGRNYRKVDERRGRPLNTVEGRQTWTVPEAAKRLGISDRSAYEAVKRGDLPAIRVGNRLLVPKAALARLLTGGSMD